MGPDRRFQSLWSQIRLDDRIERNQYVLANISPPLSIFVGLHGSNLFAVLSCIGFGFSTSFAQALFFRSLGGITNGNIGVLRTM